MDIGARESEVMRLAEIKEKKRLYYKAHKEEKKEKSRLQTPLSKHDKPAEYKQQTLTAWQAELAKQKEVEDLARLPFAEIKKRLGIQ